MHRVFLRISNILSFCSRKYTQTHSLCASISSYGNKAVSPPVVRAINHQNHKTQRESRRLRTLQRHPVHPSVHNPTAQSWHTSAVRRVPATKRTFMSVTQPSPGTRRSVPLTYQDFAKQVCTPHSGSSDGSSAGTWKFGAGKKFLKKIIKINDFSGASQSGVRSISEGTDRILQCLKAHFMVKCLYAS